MTKKIIKNKERPKPTLIVCGKHLINIEDVRMITQVRKNLYVIKFFSDPNPTYPCWVEGKHISSLLKNFNIVVTDEEEKDHGNEEEAIRWDRTS